MLVIPFEGLWVVLVAPGDPPGDSPGVFSMNSSRTRAFVVPFGVLSHLLLTENI